MLEIVWIVICGVRSKWMCGGKEGVGVAVAAR